MIVVGLMESTENAMVFTQPVSPDDLKLPGCAREKFAASSILGFGNFTSTHLGNRTQNFRRFSIRVFCGEFSLTHDQGKISERIQ